MNTIYELIKWWWQNNVEWIRLHDPWVISVIAISISLSMIIRMICVIIRILYKK